MNAPFDPWATLGLAPGASVAEARAARRRLAKQFHPDVGAPSSGAAMAEINRAVAAVEAAQAAACEAVEGGADSSAAGPGPEVEALEDDSFGVAALPVDAFEALFLAAYGLGEILVADEPYALELYLPEPVACFCALSLAPDAGGSIVSIDLVAAEGSAPPPVAAVRDLLIAELSTITTGRDPRSQETHRPDQG
jgi:hypothetical protein